MAPVSDNLSRDYQWGRDLGRAWLRELRRDDVAPRSLLRHLRSMVDYLRVYVILRDTSPAGEAALRGLIDAYEDAIRALQEVL
jgi:hypothetical protein